MGELLNPLGDKFKIRRSQVFQKSGVPGGITESYQLPDKCLRAYITNNGNADLTWLPFIIIPIGETLLLRGEINAMGGYYERDDTLVFLLPVNSEVVVSVDRVIPNTKKTVRV